MHIDDNALTEDGLDAAVAVETAKEFMDRKHNVLAAGGA